MQALKDVSKVWLVAKMVHTLFESILGNKVLEERLQKAAGKRHQRVRPDAQQQPQQQQQPHQYHQRRDLPPKRKFDDMDLGLPNGGPTPPVSYERSRPQTPAATPSRDELGQPVGAHQSSPGMPRESLTGTGLSRGNTRPTTPFNGQFSLPTTPLRSIPCYADVAQSFSIALGEFPARAVVSRWNCYIPRVIVAAE